MEAIDIYFALAIAATLTAVAVLATNLFWEEER